MMNFSMGRPHSAQTTFAEIVPVVPGSIRRLQWWGGRVPVRWSFIAGTKPFSGTVDFHKSKSVRVCRIASPLPLAMSFPWQNKAHPWSLASKLSIVTISCIIGSFSTLFPCCILECHILSNRTQKNHTSSQSCSVLLRFCSLMVLMFLFIFSLVLFFPTYSISNGICAASPTAFAIVVNFLIHSMFSPPYKHMTFLSSIWNCPPTKNMIIQHNKIEHKFM